MTEVTGEYDDDDSRFVHVEYPTIPALVRPKGRLETYFSNVLRNEKDRLSESIVQVEYPLSLIAPNDARTLQEDHFDENAVSIEYALGSFADVFLKEAQQECSPSQRDSNSSKEEDGNEVLIEYTNVGL